jgi:radical SAM protein with 4Fe4S-binding SPASM domain
MKILSAPQQICFGITNKCNLACKHCLAHATTGCREYSSDMLTNIIHQIRDMKVFKVSIFGGEPLASHHFHHVVEEFGKWPIAITLNTNATLIDRNEADWLATTHLKSYIVSLDGSCPEVHDAFRGAGSWEQAVRGIEEISRIKKPVLLSAILTRFNYRDINNMVEFARSIGFQNVRYNNVGYVGSATCFSDEIRMSPAETFEALSTVRELNKKYPGCITGSVAQQVDILDDLKERHTTTKFPLQVNPCGAAVDRITIRPDGKVAPCEIIWECVAGDLYEQSLKDIWDNSPLLKQFRETVYIEADKIPECVDCEYLRHCYLGHRCQPYYNPGQFKNKKLYCINEEVFNRS